MKSAVVLCLIIASVFAMNIISLETDSAKMNSEANLRSSQKVNNLQISNYTGSGITSDMVSNFIKVINEAYKYYGSSIQDNAEYIQDKLEGSYVGKFQVLIFPENSTASLSIYTSLSGTAYVSWSKVNTAQPTWSYIIAFLYTQDLKNTQINGLYQKGEGLTSSMEKVIQNTIAKYEIIKTCLCLTSMVSQDLEDYDGQSWNVVCTAPDVGLAGFAGLIYQKGGVYTQTVLLTKANCRYLVWVI